MTVLVRLPRFADRCPHIRDQWISVGNARLNVDHAARVLRARQQLLHTTVRRDAVKLIQPRTA